LPVVPLRAGLPDYLIGLREEDRGKRRKEKVMVQNRDGNKNRLRSQDKKFPILNEMIIKGKDGVDIEALHQSK
jgi:hypothetical protein